MVENVRTVEAALGDTEKQVAPGVVDVRRRIGRSLVTRIDLAAGEEIRESALTLKCPGDGIPWSERHRIVGRRLRRALPANSKLEAEHLD